MSPRHPTPPRPVSEHERLRQLYRRRVLGTGPEQVFDDVAGLAALLLDAPVAAVNLVDHQQVEAKAVTGATVAAVPREYSVCAYTVLGDEPLVIDDLARDPRTRANPLLTGTGLRFYAGAPILLDGHAVGAVCVFDRVARSLSTDRLAGLEALARQAAALVAGRGNRQALGDVLATRERHPRLHATSASVVPRQRRPIGRAVHAGR